MQLQIRQDFIEEAIRQHVVRMGLTIPIETITFSSTRNPPMVQAEIEFNTQGSNQKVKEVTRGTQDDSPAQDSAVASADVPAEETQVEAASEAEDAEAATPEDGEATEVTPTRLFARG